MVTLATLYNDIKTLGLQMFQEKLVSGTNIKTINNTSLLGSGNISISGGGISIDDVYPIGSIYMSTNSTSPQTLFGGTWEQIEDTFLLGCGTTYNSGATGGSADAVVVEHNHTQGQHRHEANTTGQRFLTGDFDNIGRRQLGSSGTNRGYGWTTTSTSSNTALGADTYTDYQTPTINNKGVDGTGKNMPPYLAVYIWKRTA